MKGYKGFNQDMTCRGFQYEEGKEYTCDQARYCECGFHACTEPTDCFEYYDPVNSVYHEVEANDLADQPGYNRTDSKIVGKHIKIGKPLAVYEMVEAQLESYYTERRIESSEADKGHATDIVTGRAAVANGRRSVAVATNERSIAKASNIEGVAAATGPKGIAFADGYTGIACSTGYHGIACANGDNGIAATACVNGTAICSDEHSIAAATSVQSAAIADGPYDVAVVNGRASIARANGRCDVAVASGSNAVAVANGEKSVAVATCYGGAVKGKLGCALVLIERSGIDALDPQSIKAVKAVIVDGKTVKADTWYTLYNGELKEQPDDYDKKYTDRRRA